MAQNRRRPDGRGSRRGWACSAVYGVVGDSLNGFNRRHAAGMAAWQWLHVRHEEVAAFSRRRRRPCHWRPRRLRRQLRSRAICTSSTVSSTASAPRVPVVAIAAPNPPPPKIGSHFFQETHPERLFQECSSYCELVSSPEQMPRVLEIAVRRSILERCVSVVVVPGDVALKTRRSGARAKARRARAG